jgi:hypothetical protein
MGNAIERLLLGGAFVFGGVIHRKVGRVDERVDAVEDVVEELATSPVIPGMPLPTGYGLQVKGPAGENLLVPVCLPPGFELSSLVLKPSFLPAEQPKQAPVAAEPVPAAPAPSPAPSMESDAIRVVYSDDAGFHTSGAEVLAPRPAGASAPEESAAALDVGFGQHR